MLLPRHGIRHGIEWKPFDFIVKCGQGSNLEGSLSRRLNSSHTGLFHLVFEPLLKTSDPTYGTEGPAYVLSTFKANRGTRPVVTPGVPSLLDDCRRANYFSSVTSSLPDPWPVDCFGGTGLLLQSVFQVDNVNSLHT